MSKLFAWWGRAVVWVRWLIVVAALASAGAGAVWGTGVFNSLVSQGFSAPGTESAKASQQIASAFGYRHMSPDVVVLYSSRSATVNEPGMRDPVSATVNGLQHRAGVAGVASYYGTHNPALISHDRHQTYAAIWLSAQDDNGKRKSYEALESAMRAPGVTTQIGGTVALNTTVNAISKSDVTRGERIALPAVLILMLFIFGGLVAASMPLLIGGLAILGALSATRAIATYTDVSTFAVNSITLLGLGMAVDYSLFIVSRFREEMRAGRDRKQAVAITMATAGRTVFVSGLTVALALASLLVFPEVFLRSMGLGGMAAVLVAMVSALTVLPAILAILGPRIDALRVPLPWRRRAKQRQAATKQGGWAKLANSVMRMPVPYVIVVLGVLVVLALPFARVQFGGFDERILPAGTEARVATEQIAANFTGPQASPIQVVAEGATPAQARDLSARVRSVPGVTGATVTASRPTAALVTVNYTGPKSGSQAYQAVRDIRRLAPPPGVTMLVGGSPAEDVDLIANLGSRLPWMATVMGVVTFLVLFLAFGSVMLPLDAVIMNVASIAASFGVVVWIFQEGHLSSLLGFTATGFLQPNIPILVLAVLFGLATDYEVFLLSRVREGWDATGNNRWSVANGIQRTGGIITAAALLLVVVVAGFSTGQIIFTKLIGVGMVVGLVVDATLVRMMLVPATMRLLGRLSWWAPWPFSRIYRRYGIREGEAEPSPERAGASAR